MNQQKSNPDRAITEYTAELWKYKKVPTEKIMPEPVREYLHESHTIDQFQVIAARVRGKLHKHNGTNCDDWFETENVDGIFVSAVSDGAGSKKFSRIGARAACRRARFYLKTQLGKLLTRNPKLREDLAQDMKSHVFSEAANQLASMVQDAILTAREGVIKACEDRKRKDAYMRVVGRELEAKDFACTLLVTVAVPLGKEMLVVACQVGDGITAVLNTSADFDKAVTLLGTPDSGNYSGETDFLTSAKFSDKANLANRTMLSRKPIDIIFSMTDGVADDYYPNGVQLHRLYFDLVINHVLPLPKEIGEDEQKIDVPEPHSHLELSGEEKRERVAIQYTSELCEANKMTLEELWNNRAPLGAMAKKIAPPKNRSADVRLQNWLNNYTVRGSFDDRTLVILRRGGEEIVE